MSWLLWILLSGCAAEWTLQDGDNDGFTWQDGDCDDTTPEVNPDAVELCDDIDNNCDGVVDEFNAFDATVWYVDVDGDGFTGDTVYERRTCEQPGDRFSAISDGDCQDGEDGAGIYPGAEEVCDGIDNNCDGQIDESGASGASTWAADSDGDTFGDCENTRVECDQPNGFVHLNPDDCDCDIDDALTYPGADEIPDGVDNDCDEQIDEAPE